MREARRWEEFEAAMGEVATQFSSFAEAVGATMGELGRALVDVPPQGVVTLGRLAPTLAPYEGDVRYDYLKVARLSPSSPYDFRYVQLGMPEVDAFFRASAELYATAYQLLETGRHVLMAQARLAGEDPPRDVVSGKRAIRRGEIERALGPLTDGAGPGAARLEVLWRACAELGARLAGTAAETASSGAALVSSAPSQILDPKLVLHLPLIVKGLEQSVSLVTDTGQLLTSVLS